MPLTRHTLRRDLPGRAAACSRLLALTLLTSAALYALGCSMPVEQDISTVSPYASVIGTEYEVLTDQIRLYGIYDIDGPAKRVTLMTLIPPPGISGREVAFRCAVPEGQRMRIVAARRQPMLFDNDVYYLVEFTGTAFGRGIPMQLELFRGNEGKGAEPNAALYRRIDPGAEAGRNVRSDRPAFSCPEAGSVVR